MKSRKFKMAAINNTIHTRYKGYDWTGSFFEIANNCMRHRRAQLFTGATDYLRLVNSFKF